MENSFALEIGFNMIQPLQPHMFRIGLSRWDQVSPGDTGVARSYLQLLVLTPSEGRLRVECPSPGSRRTSGGRPSPGHPR